MNRASTGRRCSKVKSDSDAQGLNTNSRLPPQIAGGASGVSRKGCWNSANERGSDIPAVSRRLPLRRSAVLTHANCVMRSKTRHTAIRSTHVLHATPRLKPCLKPRYYRKLPMRSAGTLRGRAESGASSSTQSATFRVLTISKTSPCAFEDGERCRVKIKMGEPRFQGSPVNPPDSIVRCSGTRVYQLAVAGRLAAAAASSLTGRSRFLISGFRTKNASKAAARAIRQPMM